MQPATGWTALRKGEDIGNWTRKHYVTLREKLTLQETMDLLLGRLHEWMVNIFECTCLWCTLFENNAGGTWVSQVLAQFPHLPEIAWPNISHMLICNQEFHFLPLLHGFWDNRKLQVVTLVHTMKVYGTVKV